MICEVKHEDEAHGVPEEGGGQAPEPLLARRVPQLQPHCPVLQVHRLGQEVDANCGLKHSSHDESLSLYQGASF